MNQASNQFKLGFAVKQENYSWRVLTNKEDIAFKDNMEIKRGK